MLVKKIFLYALMATGLMLGVQSCYFDKTVLIEEEETREISFAQDITPLFNASCNFSGCHNTGGTKPDLSDGKAYNALISGNYINVDAPEDSELYQWLTNKRSTPMPLSGPDPNINATVLAWIKQGARDN